jgi:hypothetical protein
MYERRPVVALRDYLATFVAAHLSLAEDSSREEMHQRVCAMVDELKAAGWPPERVIVAVKQVADDAGLRPSRGVLSAKNALTEQDTAVVYMVRWCIEQYYGVDIPPA